MELAIQLHFIAHKTKAHADIGIKINNQMCQLNIWKLYLLNTKIYADYKIKNY